MLIKSWSNSYISDIIRVTSFGLYDCTIVWSFFKFNRCVYIFVDVEVVKRFSKIL